MDNILENELKISEIIIEELEKDSILYKALKITICPKLIKEHSVYIPNLIQSIKKDDVQKNLKLSNINAKNTKESLNKLFMKFNIEFINELSYSQAQSVIFLYLNQIIEITSKSDEKTTKTTKRLNKTNYTKLIYETMISAQLIDKNYYDFVDYGFIFFTGTIKNKPDYMLCFNEITSLSEFIENITSLENDSNYKLFFRGHSNINFLNEPSVFRNGYYKKEFTMFRDLVIKCNDYFLNCKCHFDFISLMQHYGLPTRLLDITLNPLVALYFACEDMSPLIAEVIVYTVPIEKIKYRNSDTVSVLSTLSLLEYKEQEEIYINKNKLNNDHDNLKIKDKFINEIKKDKPYFINRIDAQDLIEPVFMIPDQDNKRIINQKGAFVLFGLNEEFYGKNYDILNEV